MHRVEYRAHKFAQHFLTLNEEDQKAIIAGMFENIHFKTVERNSWRELALRWRDWFKWERRNNG